MLPDKRKFGKKKSLLPGTEYRTRRGRTAGTWASSTQNPGASVTHPDPTTASGCLWWGKLWVRVWSKVFHRDLSFNKYFSDLGIQVEWGGWGRRQLHSNIYFRAEWNRKETQTQQEEKRHVMLLCEFGLPGHLELRVHKAGALMGRHHTKDRHMHRPTTQTTLPVPHVLTALKVLRFFVHCLENTTNRQLCCSYLQFGISFMTEMQMAH